MMTKQQLSLMKKVYRFGRRQLRNLLNDVRYRRLVLTEGRRLRALKDIHAGERCFMIGNGPSIRQQDLTKLHDEIKFVTNWFVLHEDYDKINPTYHCASDPRFYDTKGLNSDWYCLMTAKTKNTIKFFPLPTKKIIERGNLFKGHRIFYLDYSGGRTAGRVWETGLINLDITKPLYTGDTAIIDFCLPLAFYMGFKKVYLLGCDCDYGLERDESYRHGYFYSIDRHTTMRPNVDYHKRLWLKNVIKSYIIVKKAFERRSVKIYNAGVGGKLEVFPRVNYEEVVN